MISASPPPRPLSIAHRGASAYAPENTLEAFRKASALGADMWEIDVQMTSDGQVVVMHDTHFQDGRRVADMTLSELRQALPDCPLLEEVVAQAADLQAGLYVDFKGTDAALPVLETLKSHGIEQAILGAFDPSMVKVLRDADCPYPMSTLVPLGGDPHIHAADADVIHLCWEHSPDRVELLTSELFERSAARGQQIAIWHEEDPIHMAEIRKKPVLGICSDRPQMVNPFQPPKAWPVGIVCHRGCNAIAPENTLPALDCALAAGFSHIEVDLHLTRDKQIVVMHDPMLNRTTDGTGPITTRSLAELRSLDAGSWFSDHFAGTKLPTLDEVLDLVKRHGGRAYLESKSAPAQAVWEAVQARNMQDRCFFWSFDPSFMVALRALAPEAVIMARRMDYPSLEAALGDYDANIIEFRPGDDPQEIAALRGSKTASMVCYHGEDKSVFDQLIAMQPDLLNLDHPFAFKDHLLKSTS